jgi:hypothetical protein
MKIWAHCSASCSEKTASASIHSIELVNRVFAKPDSRLGDEF